MWGKLNVNNYFLVSIILGIMKFHPNLVIALSLIVQTEHSEVERNSLYFICPNSTAEETLLSKPN